MVLVALVCAAGKAETTGLVKTDSAGFARVRRAGAAFLMVRNVLPSEESSGLLIS